MADYTVLGAMAAEFGVSEEFLAGAIRLQLNAREESAKSRLQSDIESGRLDGTHVWSFEPSLFVSRLSEYAANLADAARAFDSEMREIAALRAKLPPKERAA